MSTAIKVSDAASLAMHTMVLLADRKDRSMTAQEIAEALKASKAHLAKVLQRLAHAGLLRSERGPGGGFMLARPGKEITLLQVYETIEGPLAASDCLLHTRLCGGKNCILGGLLTQLNAQVRKYLSKTRLTDLSTFSTGM
jgi:Rrf2 family protein